MYSKPLPRPKKISSSRAFSHRPTGCLTKGRPCYSAFEDVALVKSCKNPGQLVCPRDFLDSEAASVNHLPLGRIDADWR